MNRKKKIKMLSAKCNMPIQAQNIIANWMQKTNINSLGCKNATPETKQPFAWGPMALPCKQENNSQERVKETTMDTRTEAQQAKDYLISSLRQVRSDKFDSEYEAFNLNFKGPKTLKELRDGLKAGFVVLPKNEENWDDDTRVYSWYDYVTWQDPKKVPDQKGFDAAKKLIEKDVSEVQDTIVVFGAEKGLEALNAFKAKTYH